MMFLIPQRLITRNLVALFSSLCFLCSTTHAGVLEDLGYVPTTDVSNQLQLAWDIKAMRSAYQDFALKKQIYTAKSSSNQGSLTLQSLSLQASNKWGKYPLFNIYRETFSYLGQDVERDQPGNFDSRPVDQYADTLITDLFLLNVSNIEAESTVALSVYMAFASSLYDALIGCKNKDKTAMSQGIDQAAAYWVGAGQVRGDTQSGYFLYNLAQLVGERFNQFASGDSEVIVNNKVLAELIAWKQDINSDSTQCGTDNGFVNTRNRVWRLITHANRVLMQMLIHRIKSVPAAGGTTEFVELYALALLPWVASCNSDLRDAVIKYSVLANVDATNSGPLIQTLQKTFPCFGLTCEDIGTYMLNIIPQCTNPSQPALAGYSPTANVSSYSTIDIDIRQIRWFVKYSAMDAAMEWYKYGRNAAFSLQAMATGSLSQDVSDVYKKSMQLFGSSAQDLTWLDTLISQVFAKSGSFANASPDQLQGYLDALLRGAVLYLGVTSKMEVAMRILSSQISGTNTDALASWDQAAALFIGSMEGANAGGSSNPGEALYGLANTMCARFNVCDSSSKASINQGILSSLTAGSAAIKNKDSGGLSNMYSNDLAPALLIPVLQAMLSAAIEAGVAPTSIYKGYEFGYSRSVLGYFSSVDVTTLKLAVDQTPSTSVTSTIFDQITTLVSNTAFKVDCQKVGKIRGSDNVSRGVCQGQTVVVPAPAPTPVPNNGNGKPSTLPPSSVTRGPVAEKPVAQVSSQGVAWGRFSFTDSSVASKDSMISVDVKRVWAATDVTTASKYYTSGQNFLSGLYGLSDVTTLASISSSAKTTMGDYVIYNFYRIAFIDDQLFDDPYADTWNFANSVVQAAFLANSPSLAGEMAVALHSFLLILRQLNMAASRCSSGVSSEALRYLDSAVAIWIGNDQAQGKFNSGYMLYSLAQQALNNFGRPEGEAPANAELMGHFNDAQSIISNFCSSAPQEGYRKMRMKIVAINRALLKPLVQLMLYYIAIGDAKFGQFYSMAVLPQIGSCNAGDFAYMKNVMFKGAYNNSTKAVQSTIMDYLGSGLFCLRFTCDDIGDASSSNYPSLKSLVSGICGNLNAKQGFRYLAGYETKTPVGELARLDLDVLRIYLLMQAKAISGAKEIYELGYSSLQSNDTLYNLKYLSANFSSPNSGKLASEYAAYYNTTQNFPDSYISNILNIGDGAYKSASRRQKAEAVYRMLQASVMYLGIASNVERAQKSCESGGQGEPFVDAAAALFIGSIEGPRSGGSNTDGGVLLMDLGKETCSFFDKCESQGDSTSNEFILFAFADMRQWLSTRECDSARSIKDESLLPMLAVNTIQAILALTKLSASLSAGSDDAKLSGLDAFAKALLPQVRDANATSAAFISKNTAFGSGKPVPDGLKAMFNAFTYVVRPMGIDCDVIGTLQSDGLSTCDETKVAPAPNTPTNLGGNVSTIYTSTTYVQDRADIALDVKQMEDDLMLNRKDIAQLIYKEGQNSPVYDKFGIEVDKRSLGGFSTNASNAMTFNPLFQTAVYALKDQTGAYLGNPASQYADSIVQESFAKTQKSTVPAEAAVALNLWMEVANQLYDSLENCKDRKILDEDGIHSMDEVAAYWIGDGEVAGDAAQGHLLYNLAEQMAVKFGTRDASGLAQVNIKFLRALNEARLYLSFPQSCSDDLSTVRKLQRTINKIVAQMLTLQVQCLIYYMLADDRDRVRVYAHGFVPFVRACNSAAFATLKAKLIDGTYDGTYDKTQADALISKIYDVLPCFSITCADVGTPQGNQTTAVCSDDPSQAVLAGYRPGADVLPYARLDLDMVLIDILLSQQAYGVAKDIYMFGRSPTPDGTSSLSLQSLARSPGRSSVPEYNNFVEYYSGDNYYADTMIMQALNSATIPDIQRQAIVVGVSQYMVMYMAVLEQMYGAISACRAGANDDSISLFWGKAAAYIIGSMEGTTDEPYDRRGGVFLWGLAKKYCKEWGTCSNIITGTPDVDQKMRSLLYTGRGAAVSKGCDALQKATEEMIPLLRVPLLQIVLSYLTKLSQRESGPDRDSDYAQSYVAARSLLPLVDKRTRDLLERNLNPAVLPFAKDSSQTVTTSVVNSVGTLGVNCEYVGKSGTINACTGKVSPPSNVGLIVGLTLGLLFGILLAILLFYWNSKRRRKTGEKALFVRNKKGVLDESNKEFDPNGSGANGGAENRSVRSASTDDMDHHNGANAAKDDFMDVDLPEAV